MPLFYIDSSLYVLRIKNTAIKKVRKSASGKDQRMPSKPRKIGRIIGRNTPKMISLAMDTMVEAAALPSACR